MVRLLQVRLVGVTLAGPASVRPARAAPPADATVGGSCTENDLDTALSAGGTITFACGGPKTITLTSAKTISQDTTLDGGDVITLTGAFATRLFAVDSGVAFRLEHIVLDSASSSGGDGVVANHGRLTLDHTTIQDSQTDSSHSGGGLYAAQGTLTLSGTQFISNTAVQYGGGAVDNDEGSVFTLTTGNLSHNLAQDGGGLNNDIGASAVLVNVTVNGNAASVSGGGVANDTHGRVVISNTSLSGNTALNGAGLANFSSGVITLTASTISRNLASQTGGGVLAGSGAVTLLNATVSGNSTVTGGGLFKDSATVLLANVTVSDNSVSSGDGGGLANEAGTLLPGNSLLVGNWVGGNCFQSAGFFTSLGYNLSDDSTCADFFTNTGDQNNVAAHQGPLGNHGGPTETQLPGEGSPVIDAIPFGTNSCGTLVASDQRGFARPFNNKCDIGAVETGYMAPVLWLSLLRR